MRFCRTIGRLQVHAVEDDILEIYRLDLCAESSSSCASDHQALCVVTMQHPNKSNRTSSGQAVVSAYSTEGESSFVSFGRALLERRSVSLIDTNLDEENARTGWLVLDRHSITHGCVSDIALLLCHTESSRRLPVI